jgi:GAF domain-containing protein
MMGDDAVDQRRRGRLASLGALGAALNAETDLDALLARICQEARDLFGVGGVYLSRLDERARELVGWAGSDPSFEPEAAQRVPIVNRDDALGRAIAERRAVIEHHIQPEGAYAELITAYGVRSILLAPLRSGERVLGLLALIGAEHDDRFGPEDAELGQAFADLAAAAIEGARLHQAERDKRERLMMLARVNQLLASSLEREEVLEAIASGAQRLLGVDDVVIRLFDRVTERFHLAYLASQSGLVPWAELEMGSSKMGEVAREGRPWQTADLMRETLAANGQRRFWAAASQDLHGCLLIPLVARGRLLGCIAMLTLKPRTFDEDEVELGQAFADQAALAVRNAETLAQERRASRFEQIVQRAKGLDHRDRLHVEQILAAAERALELSEA